MRSIFRLFAVFAIVQALGGCAATEGVKPFWALNDAHIQRLKPGMTQAEVQEIMGKPPWKLAVPAKDEEIWSYNYLDYQTHMRSSLHFDGRGILKSATREFDTDYYSMP